MNCWSSPLQFYNTPSLTADRYAARRGLAHCNKLILAVLCATREAVGLGGAQHDLRARRAERHCGNQGFQRSFVR
jgi:hypothetical protein